MCAPGTIKTHRKFESQLYVLSKEEGGRHTAFVDGYKPQLFTRTGDVTATVILEEGKVGLWEEKGVGDAQSNVESGRTE